MVDDGLGWWMEYVGKLLKYYPHFGLEYIQYELPMQLGWALLNWSTEHDGWLMFCNVKKISPGYIGQEVSRLEKEYYDMYPRTKAI